MKIENRYNVSFKKLIVEDSVKQALVPFIKQTDNDALSDLEAMLGNFKKQLTSYAKRLNKDKYTRGVDIVFSDSGSASCDWRAMPSLTLVRDEKMVSEYLHFYDFETKNNPKIDKERIATIGKKLTSQTNDWFEKSVQAIETEAQNARSNRYYNREDIIKRIFG